MRLYALFLAGAAIPAAIPFSAEAAPVAADYQAAASARQVTSATYTYPPGYYWEPDAYGPHGKFRPAHCALHW